MYVCSFIESITTVMQQCRQTRLLPPSSSSFVVQQVYIYILLCHSIRPVSGVCCVRVGTRTAAVVVIASTSKSTVEDLPSVNFPVGFSLLFFSSLSLSLSPSVCVLFWRFLHMWIWLLHCFNGHCSPHILHTHTHKHMIKTRNVRRRCQPSGPSQSVLETTLTTVHYNS